MMCLLPACASAPRAKMIGGGAIAASGFIAIAHHANGHCEPQGDRYSDICDEVIAQPVNAVSDVMTMLLGTGLVILGGGLFIDGLHDLQEENDAEDAERSQIVVSPHATPLAAPAPSSYAADLPANAVIVDRIENRLAIQASLIARTGNCTSAIATGNELAKHDPKMFAALLAADADLKACYDENPPSP